VSTGSPLVTARVDQGRSSTTARMNSSVTRTEWLAFWKKTSRRPAGRVEGRVVPRVDQHVRLALLARLAVDEVDDVGWSALRITILAARRVLPPDLITPAKAS